MSIEFKTRQEFNRFTQYASTLFEMKLSNVRYKTAKQMGFKNDNALTATLPEELKQTNKIHEKELLETLDKKFISENIEFETYSVFEGHINTIEMNLPRFAKMMYDGYKFEDNEWLSKKMYGLREDSDSYNYEKPFFELESESMNKNDYRYSMSVALLQQYANGTTYDVDFFKENRNLLSEFVSGGSIDQFNIICNTPEIIELLDDTLLEQLGFKYISILFNLNGDSLDDFFNDSDYFYSLFNPQKNKIRDKETALTVFTTLATPPIEALKSDELHDLGEGIVAELLEYFFPILDTNIGESILTETVENLKKFKYEKDLELNSLEINTLKHVSLATNLLCNKILAGQGQDYSITDFSVILYSINLLNVDTELFNKVLKYVPNKDSGYINFTSNVDDCEDTCFYNTNLAAWSWLSLLEIQNLNEKKIEKLKKETQHLFSFYNDDILDSKVRCFNSNSKFDNEDIIKTLGKTKKELSQYNTLRELMTLIMKR